MSKLGSFFREARVRAGLSQKEVAGKLGYHTAQVVSDWERGVRSPPGIVLKRLMRLYEVPPGHLFDLMLAEQTAVLEAKLRRQFGMPGRRSGS